MIPTKSESELNWKALLICGIRLSAAEYESSLWRRDMRMSYIMRNHTLQAQSMNTGNDDSLCQGTFPELSLPQIHTACEFI